MPLDTAFYIQARRNMLDSQLMPNGVNDPQILKAFEAVQRECFLPAPLKSLAYIDDDISLGAGRRLMSPMVLARLVQALEVKPQDMCLVIGAATGYGAAILARLGAMALALESDANLAAFAGHALSNQGNDSVAVLEGPLAQGCPAQAPFDTILLEGCVEELPAALKHQLADGGRMAGVRLHEGVGRAFLILRAGDLFTERFLFDASAPNLPGFEKPEGFVFAAE